MLTIAIANQKGGVGKTTTAVTLAHGLALNDLRVLLIDLDVQGHASVALGLEPEPGLHQWLAADQPLERVVVKARKNLDLLPSDRMTENTKRYVAGMDFREYVLANALADADYDVALMDCAPSADVLHVSALVASQLLLVPTRLDPLSTHGVGQILSMMETVQSRGHNISFFGILPTFYERRTKETYEQLKSLAETFGEFVWPPIPKDTKAREAPAYGQTLWEYASGSSAIRGYSFSEKNGASNRVGGYLEALQRVMEAIPDD